MIQKFLVSLAILLNGVFSSSVLAATDEDLFKLFGWQIEKNMLMLEGPMANIEQQIAQELEKEVSITMNSKGKMPPNMLGDLASLYNNLPLMNMDIRIREANCADYLLLFYMNDLFDYELETGKRKQSKKTLAEKMVWEGILPNASIRATSICDDADFQAAGDDPRVKARQALIAEVYNYKEYQRKIKAEKKVKQAIQPQVKSKEVEQSKEKSNQVNKKNFQEGYAYFQNENGLYGFIDQYGNVQITPKYLGAGGFYYGRAVVKDRSSKQWGYIDKNENWIVKPQYCMAGRFSEGLAAVYVGGKIQNGECHGGKWGFIDINGRLVIAPKYERVWAFSKTNGKILAKFEHRGFSGFINQKGEWVK